MCQNVFKKHQRTKTKSIAQSKLEGYRADQEKGHPEEVVERQGEAIVGYPHKHGAPFLRTIKSALNMVLMKHDHEVFGCECCLTNIGMNSVNRTIILRELLRSLSLTLFAFSLFLRNRVS
jgi:hypothetical protein